MWFVVLCSLCGFVAANTVDNDTAEGNAAAKYLEAQSQIADARYADALATLRSLQREYPAYSNITTVQTRIAVLTEHREAAGFMPVFMLALDQRDMQRYAQAIDTLSSLSNSPDNHPLTDDALYLKAYLEIMDMYRFDDARASIEQLLQRIPDTAYADSATYLDAIALEQSGHTDQARLALRLLRERHTALSLPFGFRWPASGVMSRYWFERADRRLAILHQHSDVATRLRGERRASNGSVVIDVEAGGQRYSLTLLPSPVIKEVQWTDEKLDERAPPALAVYSGVVTDEPDSWARVVIDGLSVSGMISVNGQRSRLQPDQMIGTMNYYKAGTRDIGANDADQPDYLTAPIEGETIQTRMAELHSATRLVSMSIVVDAAFDDYYGGQGMAQALNNINMADGIYREQGLALSIDKVQSLSGDNPPVVTDERGTLESLLESFRDYRMQQSVLYNKSALVYLFTGAETADRTLGLAWIDTLCRLDGYDVGLTTPSSYANVLTAHEIGHSFGALHDSETACQADSGKIMWPRISANTQAEFSSCSIEKVALARASQCLGNAVDVQMSASIEEDIVTLNVRNSDTLIPVTADVNIDAVGVDIQWPSTCVEQTPGSASCVLANLGATSSYEIKLVVIDSGSDGLINAQAEADIHDPEPVNNAVSIDLSTGLIAQSTAMFDPISPSTPTLQRSGGSGSVPAITLLLILLAVVERLHLRRCCSRYRS